MSGCPSSKMNVTVNNVTQGIVFINERPAGYTSNCEEDNFIYTGVELCEVKVMGIYHLSIIDDVVCVLFLFCFFIKVN